MESKNNNILTPPVRPMRFLIGGVHFGHQNVGDEAILDGVITVLRNICPDCEISVLTDDPRRTAQLLNVRAYKFRFYTATGYGYLTRARRMCARVLENILHAYVVMRNDIVICAGATILSDSPATVIRLSSLGIAANKRLIYFPGGMNSGNSPETLRLLVDVGRQFDLFLTRDSASRKRLLDADWGGGVTSTVDPAFNLRGWEEQEDVLQLVPWFSEGKQVVAIGISNEPDCKNHNKVNDWAMIADFVIRSLDAHVLFLPSNTELGKDLVVMKKVYVAMRYQEKAMVIEEELQPKAMISLIANLDMMISSRMHQLIFSAMATTPFIGISRCDKIDTFLSFFDMTAASSTQNCTLDKLQATLERVWEQRIDIKKQLVNVTSILQGRSCETELLVRRCLKNIESSPPLKRSAWLRIKYLRNAFVMRLGKGVKDAQRKVVPPREN